MPTEVCSPITRKGSKQGSDQPLSPGARSMPGATGDSVPQQTSGSRSSKMAEEPIGSEVKVTGPGVSKP
jgi:hypothetical protein